MQCDIIMIIMSIELLLEWGVLDDTTCSLASLNILNSQLLTDSNGNWKRSWTQMRNLDNTSKHLLRRMRDDFERRRGNFHNILIELNFARYLEIRTEISYVQYFTIHRTEWFVHSSVRHINNADCLCKTVFRT